jgi:hypothetical protein
MNSRGASAAWDVGSRAEHCSRVGAGALEIFRPRQSVLHATGNVRRTNAGDADKENLKFEISNWRSQMEISN